MGTKEEDVTRVLGGGNMSPSDQPTVGEGRYQLVELLGRGGMGEVWRGWDTMLSRFVAIKVLLPQYAADASFVERFDREARTLSALAHPNIVPIYDVGSTTNGSCFLVMPLLEGQSLEAVIRGLREKTSSVTSLAALTLLRQIALALAAAHAKGILHRDLKPANMFVAPNGHVWVIDWGLGKRSRSVEDATVFADDRDVTDPGAILGTPRYMSPEQARAEELDSRSDCWSLALVAVELLTNGHHLLPGDSVAAIIAWLQSNEECDDIGKILPGFSWEFAAVLQALLRKNRAERTDDAGRIAEVCNEEIAHLRVPEAMEHIRAWLTTLRLIRRIERELRSLERGEHTPPAIAQHQVLEEQLRVLTEETEPQIERINAEAACASALLGEPRFRFADAWRITRHFYRRALREGEWRRRRGEILRYEKAISRTVPAIAQGIIREERRIAITSDPPGACVTLSRFVEDGARKVLTDARVIGETPLMLPLTRGEEWCFTFTFPGHRTVLYPFAVTSRPRVSSVAVTLYREEEVGRGWAHIPAGWYVIGGGHEKSFASRRQRSLWVPDFFMKKDFVTRRLYDQYLDALPHEERTKRWPSTWEAGAVLLPPDAAVDGISWDDAVAYAEWWSKTCHDVIMLPTEDQWEAAMRGPLGWFLASGDRFDPALLPNRLMGMRTMPVVGSFTPTGMPAGADVSVFGVNNPTLLSSFALYTRDEMVPEGSSSGRHVVRSGAHLSSWLPMHYVTSRYLIGEEKTWICGIRLVRYPRFLSQKSSP